jgi:hypothetical protein
MRNQLIVIAFLIVGIAGCKKDPDTVPAGRVRLLINVNHHGINIPNAVVYRKDSTLIFPGLDTTLYTHRYITDQSGNLIIDQLGNGERTMVLYAKGIDPSWDSTQQTPVWGYQFVNFITTIGESKDVPVVIPVSE